MAHVGLGGPEEQGFPAAVAQGSGDAVHLLGVADLRGAQGRSGLRSASGAWLWAGPPGPHLGACAVGFDVLKGLRGQPSWLVQGTDELLLGLSAGEGHACGDAQGSAPRPRWPVGVAHAPALSHLAPCSRLCWCLCSGWWHTGAGPGTSWSAGQPPRPPSGSSRPLRAESTSGLGAWVESSGWCQTRLPPAPGLTVLVEGLAGARGAEHAQLRELHGGVRLEQDVDAAHDGHGALPTADGLVGVVQGQQAGGAGRVQADAGPCTEGTVRGCEPWGPWRGTGGKGLPSPPTVGTHL